MKHVNIIVMSSQEAQAMFAQYIREKMPNLQPGPVCVRIAPNSTTDGNSFPTTVNDDTFTYHLDSLVADYQ